MTSAIETLEQFGPIFEQCESPEFKLTKKSKEIIHSLFDRMDDACRDNIFIEPLHVSKNSLPKGHDDLYSKTTLYFPDEIKQIILSTREKTLYQYPTYTLNDDKKINIWFVDFNNDKRELFNLRVHYMLSWLKVAFGFTGSKPCKNSTINIYIYLTPHLKILPPTGNTPIKPINVNTGFTTSCRENVSADITVFRREEWFKVFLHESFHHLGLDFNPSVRISQIPVSTAKILNKIKVQSDVNLFETYTELWADLWNILFAAYHHPGGKKWSKFIDHVNAVIQVEREFAIYQAAKILQHHHLSWNQFSHSSKEIKSYPREQTNIMAYYLLRASVVWDLNTFLTWCNENNQSGQIIAFNLAKEGEFADFILTGIHRPKHMIDCFQTYLTHNKTTSSSSVITTTLRMTMSDFL